MTDNNTQSKPEHEIRLDKLDELRNQGINPYPASAERSHTIKQVLESFSDLDDKENVTVTGRIKTIRRHGGSSFANLDDGSGQIQVYLKKDEVGDAVYEQFSNLIDAADFIQVTGTAFETKKGEQSILVSSYTLLSKALLPLPEKYHGLKDEEERFRKRYLDIFVNDGVKDLLIKKSRFWNAVRTFLLDKEFVEVETPVLETTTGGADARPFVTHHNALDIDVYLRISAGELWQKKLMAAGFDKTFEIGRIFRNEGMDAEHLQDYTQMEWYWAYADWKDGMKLFEELTKYVATTVFGTLQFNIKEFTVDLADEWATYDYHDEIQQRTSIDIDTTTVDEIKDKLQELKVDYDDFDNLERGIDQLWKYCRKQIAGPGFLIYPPKVVSPLAKEDPERSGYVQRYQMILAGSELCNGYSELNDPIDQEERFVHQQTLREAGDDEAQMHDRDFVEMLKHGMPPTNGLGFSERLFSFLADKPIREAQFFPLMKPRSLQINIHDAIAISDTPKASINSESEVFEPFAREKAIEILHEHVQSDSLRKHMYAAEAVMRALARKFGEDEDAWGLAGLLHDVDWEETENDPSQHSIKSKKYLSEAGLDPKIVNAIYVHNHMHGIEPETIFEKALYCAEELTGLITACALVRPDKKIDGVKSSSIRKKFKQPAFAAGVQRDIVARCDELINMKLEELIELELEAMKEIADDLGL